jgi:hypothetical protein
MRSDEEIQAAFIEAFRPLHSEVRLDSWNGTITVAVLDQQNNTLVKAGRLVNEMRDGSGIYELIAAMRALLVEKGAHINAWSPPPT